MLLSQHSAVRNTHRVAWISLRQMPCALLELNIDLLWNNVLRAINSRIRNIHWYHEKLLADSCTLGSRIWALWHVIQSRTESNSELIVHKAQSSYRKRNCMLSQITLRISTHVHCISQNTFILIRLCQCSLSRSWENYKQVCFLSCAPDETQL